MAGQQQHPHGKTLRRLILVALVAAALLNLLAACATPAVQCQMRDDYTVGAGVPVTGSVTLTWVYGQGFGGRQYGEAIDAGGLQIVRLAGDPPDFNDICGLARLGHEVAHALGGRHQ